MIRYIRKIEVVFSCNYSIWYIIAESQKVTFIKVYQILYIGQKATEFKLSRESMCMQYLSWITGDYTGAQVK